LLIFQRKGTLAAGGGEMVEWGDHGGLGGFTPSLVKKLKKAKEAPWVLVFFLGGWFCHPIDTFLLNKTMKKRDTVSE
jgi:hypothetical protein